MTLSPKLAINMGASSKSPVGELTLDFPLVVKMEDVHTLPAESVSDKHHCKDSADVHC